MRCVWREKIWDTIWRNQPRAGRISNAAWKSSRLLGLGSAKREGVCSCGVVHRFLSVLFAGFPFLSSGVDSISFCIFLSSSQTRIMPATQALRQKTEAVTANQSLTLTKNLLRASVSSIAFMRNLFPDDCFVKTSGECFDAALETSALG